MIRLLRFFFLSFALAEAGHACVRPDNFMENEWQVISA